MKECYHPASLSLPAFKASLLLLPDGLSELNPENSSIQNDPHQPVSGLQQQQQQQQQPHEATTNIQTDFCTQRKRVNGILFYFFQIINPYFLPNCIFTYL